MIRWIVASPGIVALVVPAIVFNMMMYSVTLVEVARVEQSVTVVEEDVEDHQESHQLSHYSSSKLYNYNCHFLLLIIFILL